MELELSTPSVTWMTNAGQIRAKMGEFANKAQRQQRAFIVNVMERVIPENYVTLLDFIDLVMISQWWIRQQSKFFYLTPFVLTRKITRFFLLTFRILARVFLFTFLMFFEGMSKHFLILTAQDLCLHFLLVVSFYPEIGIWPTLAIWMKKRQKSMDSMKKAVLCNLYIMERHCLSSKHSLTHLENVHRNLGMNVSNPGYLTVLLLEISAIFRLMDIGRQEREKSWIFGPALKKTRTNALVGWTIHALKKKNGAIAIQVKS